MTTLTIEDEEDTLWVHFGPLPLFSTWIRFDEIQSLPSDPLADHRRLGHPLHSRPRLDVEPVGF